MPGWKSPKMVKIIDFRIFRMPHLKCTKMVEIMDFRIFRRSQKPSRPGNIRKHQKRFKISSKGTSRTTFGSFFIKYRSKRERRPKAAALFWERPKAATICDEKASKNSPGDTFLIHFDSFLMFSGVPRSRRFLGFPENPIFHHFDHFGTFQTGHPELPKIHHLVHKTPYTQRN